MPPDSRTFTFLFTDIERSTRLWQELPDAMADALAQHDAIVRDAIESHHGRVVKHTGDGAHAVFASPRDAVDAAIAIQTGLVATDLGTGDALRARVSIHTGTAIERDGDYFGTTVNRAARIMAAGHGGQILASQATQLLVEDSPGRDFELVDLGEYRLRDLDRPDRLFQVVSPGLPDDFPPVRSTAFVPGNLPADAGSLVGREGELTAVAALLQDARLVTVTGPGGIGKTTLSGHVARHLSTAFPDGLWFCELAAAERAEALVEVVAAALGVQPVPGMSLEESLAAFLSGRRALVVLDNCEHVVERAARLAAAVLRDAPELRLLATSREPLGVTGERTFPLGPLTVPDPTGDVPTIAASPSVRVFVARAAAARPDFELTEANADAVADLCRHLDGIPLALELAAARVAVMTPREILDRLGERFRLLTGGPRTVAARHQTLHAAVDWSYSLLDDSERTVFARLGVFAGAFDLGAAEHVAGDDSASSIAVDEVLARLVTKSMITASSQGATTRFQLLETLRDYALEQLDDQEACRRRHAAFYAGFAEQAGAALLGDDEPAWRMQVRADLDNLRAAVDWALASAPDTELAVRIVGALAREASRDRSSGIGGWAERSLSAAATAPPRLRTAVRAAAAQEALGRDDVPGALALAKDAVADGIPPGCPAPGYAHCTLATAQLYSGRVLRATQILADALAELDDGGHDAYSRASTLAVAAQFRVFAFDPVGARADAEAAVHLARSLGNPSVLADALYSLSWACWNDDPDLALASLDECTEVAREGGAVTVMDGALGQAARLRVRRGDVVAALALLREALVHSHQSGYRRGVLFTIACAVEVFAAVGSLDAALTLSEIDGAIPLWEPVLPAGGLAHAVGAERARAAVERAAAMKLDEITAYTLGELDRLLSVAGQSQV